MHTSKANLGVKALIPVLLLILWSELGLLLGGILALLFQSPQRSLVRFSVRLYIFLFFPIYCIRLARLLINPADKEVTIENDWVHFYYLNRALHCRLSGLKVLVQWRQQTYACTLDCYPVVIGATKDIVLQEIENQRRE
jgi:hypothetical protein